MVEQLKCDPHYACRISAAQLTSELFRGLVNMLLYKLFAGETSVVETAVETSVSSSLPFTVARTYLDLPTYLRSLSSERRLANLDYCMSGVARSTQHNTHVTSMHL